MQYPNLIIINQILQEYLNKRLDESVNTYLGKAVNIGHLLLGSPKSIPAMTQICETISKECATAAEGTGYTPGDVTNSAKLWAELLITLGEKAFEAQQDAASHSVFCETLHAIRSYILQFTTTFPELATHIELNIVNLEAELKNTNNKIADARAHSIENTNEMKYLENKRNETLRSLAYLGQIQPIRNLKNNEIIELFPKLEFQLETPKIQLSFQNQNTEVLQFHKNIPMVIHGHYYKEYLKKYLVKSINEAISTTEYNLVSRFCARYHLDPNMILGQYTNTVPAKISIGTQTENISQQDAHPLLKAAQAIEKMTNTSESAPQALPTLSSQSTSIIHRELDLGASTPSNENTPSPKDSPIASEEIAATETQDNLITNEEITTADIKDKPKGKKKVKAKNDDKAYLEEQKQSSAKSKK